MQNTVHPRKSLLAGFLAALTAILPLAGLADGTTQPLWPASGMSDAYLEWSAAPAEKTGSCVILVAGGDYASTNAVPALRPLEQKLLSNGVSCVWLHYRTSANGQPAYQAAWEDGQRAVRLVRQAASERGYGADKIGVLGFSDGAHLALLLATSSQTAAYARVDDVDDIACNVNFAIPMSPTGVLTTGTTVDSIFAFDAKTCTTCLFHGQDDAVTSPIATTRIYRKLRTTTVAGGAKVPSEIHIIPEHGHDLVSASEFERAIEYMCQMGFLGALGAEVQLNSRFSSDADRASNTLVYLWPENKTPDFQSEQNVPYLEWHMPKELKSRAVQILYAGGAYGFNNPQDFEVTPLRRYLNAKGMAVVTIKYRCPRPNGLPKHMSAWQDLQRTIRFVRDEAPRRGLDPDSIGIMGCSAGGHLTLMGATTSLTPAYAPIDDVDSLSCSVKWAIAIYPAYALTDGADSENANGGNLDTDVLVDDFAFDAKTCKMFFMHGDDDSYAAMNSVKCWEKLRTMGIESELHTLATRRHTFQQNASPGTASYNINDIIWDYVDDFAAAAVAPTAVDGQPSGDQSGITDTKMIQDLIDAAAPTHGTVELSAGTFYINAQLNITNGVTLVGQGWTNTVIKQVAIPNWNETVRCAVIDGGAKIEGFALTGGYIKNPNDFGAGVWVKNGTVSWCCITNNVGGHHNASGYGVSFSGGQGAIDHSIVADNVSASGFQGGTGAGIAVNGTAGAVTIDTCLVVGNVTTNNGASGGGVYVKDLAGNCTVRNCTIAGNKAVANAGGIDLASASGPGKLVLVNTILVGNKVSGTEVNLRNNNSFFDATNSKNCFVGLASETTVNIGGVNHALEGFLSGDPGFVDAANGNYRLAAGSAAIGAGAAGSGAGTDLDAKAFAATPSIGCYEAGGGEPPAPHVHAWGAPTFAWTMTASGYDCTATAVCAGDSTHTTNETVTATYEVVQAPTDTAAGEGIYTATFVNAPFTATQTKTVRLPKTGSDPTDAVAPSGDATGATDARTIQDLIDAAAPTHGTVTLGSGTFHINAQLMVTGGVTLAGQGWENTVVKQVATAGWDEASAKRCAVVKDGSKIEGMALTGGNSAVAGAGVLVENGVISWCCITNNTVKQYTQMGGGVCFKGGEGSIDHSIVAYNKINTASSYGGGIGVTATTGPVLIDTCLIYGNSCSLNCGGGIAIKSADYDCTVRSCTVANNSAGSNSAGIFRETGSGNLVLIDTIAVANANNNGESNIQTGWMPYDATNSKNCFFGLPAEAEKIAGSLSGDPLFVDPANGDYRLDAGSTAIGAGAAYAGIGTDLDDKDFAATPSIGCYEAGGDQPPDQPTPPVLGTVTATPGTTTATIAGTIASVGNNGATACDVYLALDDGAATKIVEGATTSFSYEITGLTALTAYDYALSVSNNAATPLGATTNGSFRTKAVPVGPDEAIVPGDTPEKTRWTIQDAIDAAAILPEPGTVTLGEGLFEIDAQLMVTGGVTLVGQGWENTVLKQVAATPTADTRVVWIDGGATVERLAITGGSVSRPGGWSFGAGACVKNGTISWCCITNNTSGADISPNNYGGGVSFDEGMGRIDHSIVADNLVKGLQTSFGGGIAIRHPIGAVTIDACLISGNVVRNAQVGGGTPRYGGGAGIVVEMVDRSKNYDMTVRSSTIVGNSAEGTSAKPLGGAVFTLADTGSKFAMLDCIVAGNTTAGTNATVELSYDGGVDYCLFDVEEDKVGEHSLYGAPAFVDAADGDYRLALASPAVGSGETYAGIGNDLNDAAFSDPPSMGCYEYGELAAKPAFDVASGTAFHPTMNVTLICATAGATIYYTTDGSRPTDTSTPYTGPIEVSATTTIKARAYAAGLGPSAVATATYTYREPVDPGAILPVAGDPAATRWTIQDAIDAAAPTQGTVVLADGIFEIDAQLNVTGGVTLVGQGWENTVIKPAAGFAIRCAMLDDGATVAGLTLTGGDANAQSGATGVEVAANTPSYGGAGAWVRNGTISWCCISNNVGSTHQVYGCGVSFSDGQGTIDHCLVANNRSTQVQNTYGAGIGAVDTAGPVIIDACLVVDNRIGGNGSGGGIGIRGANHECVVRNCTVAGNTGTTYVGGIRFEHMAGFAPGKVTIINTIAVGNKMGVNESNYSITDVLKDAVHSRNCFFGLESEASQTSGSLYGDPLFVNAADGDYHLQATSPAKEAGWSYTYIDKDLDDKYFVWDTPSMGCYEYDPNARPRPWDIPGPNGGGIQALDDYHGNTYIVFTSIALTNDTLTVGFRAGKVDGDGMIVALLCKENLTDTETFRLPATLTNGSLDTLGTLEAVLDRPYPHLFAVGVATLD